MIPHDPPGESRDVILKKIKWLMSLRLMIATFSLGTAALIQITKNKPYLDSYLSSLYIIIGLIYTLSLLYAFVLKKARYLNLFAYVQIIVDILLVTALIKVTGGAGSVFSLFYYLSIIAASTILYRSGGIIIASLSSILYICIVVMEYYHLVRPVVPSVGIGISNAGSLLFNIMMNVTAFFLIALLSSFLSEQVRRSNEALQIKEHDYQRLETLHQNIIQSINSGLFTVDSGNTISFLNRAAEAITGYTSLDVCGRQLSDVFPELSGATGVDKTARTDGRGARFEVSFKRPDGVVVHLGFSKSILKDSEGNYQGEVYTFQDVTRLKQMEEHVKLVDRLAAIGRLATGMAHEIRNPLASMSGSIQMLGESLQLDPSNRRLMEIVLRETNRLDQLLNDFVLFTHPDDRRKEQVELNGIINDVLQLFSYNPLKNGIEVVGQLEGEIVVEADRRQIEQVLWNLFVNAAQAINGRGTLTVSSEAVHFDKLDEGAQARLDGGYSTMWARLSVDDTGRGIPESYLDKIFDPFFTTKDKGIGLGLAIVYSIIESYHGIIEVKSSKGKGTNFTIYLPSVSNHNS